MQTNQVPPNGANGTTTRAPTATGWMSRLIHGDPPLAGDHMHLGGHHEDRHVPAGEPLLTDPGLPVDGGRPRKIYNLTMDDRAHRLAPGTALLVTAAVLILGLAATMAYVSWFAQFTFILDAKHGARLPSELEAVGLDAGAVIFALLGLAHARMGRPAFVERALNLACAFGSMTMNLLGADLASPRSVAAYVLPAVLYAAASDRLIAVVAHQAGVNETSVWQRVGVVCLYLLRFALAFPSTWGGLRRRLLQMTPLPAADKPRTRPVTSTTRPRPPVDGKSDTSGRTPPANRGPSKKSVFLDLYDKHPARGDRAKAAQVAAELAPRAGLAAGTGRTYLVEWFAGQAAKS